MNPVSTTYNVRVDPYGGDSSVLDIAALTPTIIGRGAFMGSESLIEVIIPEGVTHIEDEALC